MADRDALEAAVGGRDVEEAPVGEIEHEAVRDPLQRRRVVERAREHVARGREHELRLARAILRGVERARSTAWPA